MSTSQPATKSSDSLNAYETRISSAETIGLIKHYLANDAKPTTTDNKIEYIVYLILRECQDHFEHGEKPILDRDLRKKVLRNLQETYGGSSRRLQIVYAYYARIICEIEANFLDHVEFSGSCRLAVPDVAGQLAGTLSFATDYSEHWGTFDALKQWMKSNSPLGRCAQYQYAWLYAWLLVNAPIIESPRSYLKDLRKATFFRGTQFSLLTLVSGSKKAQREVQVIVSDEVAEIFESVITGAASRPQWAQYRKTDEIKKYFEDKFEIDLGEITTLESVGQQSYKYVTQPMCFTGMAGPKRGGSIPTSMRSLQAFLGQEMDKKKPDKDDSRKPNKTASNRYANAKEIAKLYAKNTQRVEVMDAFLRVLEELRALISSGDLDSLEKEAADILENETALSINSRVPLSRILTHLLIRMINRSISDTAVSAYADTCLVWPAIVMHFSHWHARLSAKNNWLAATRELAGYSARDPRHLTVDLCAAMKTSLTNPTDMTWSPIDLVVETSFIPTGTVVELIGPSEFRQIWDIFKGDPTSRLILALTYGAGLRICECFRTPRRNILIEGDEIRLRVGGSKSTAGEFRSLPLKLLLPPAIYGVVFRDMKNLILEPGSSERPIVPVDTAKQPLIALELDDDDRAKLYDQYARPINEALKNTTGRQVTLHPLRHTFACHLAARLTELLIGKPNAVLPANLEYDRWRAVVTKTLPSLVSYTGMVPDRANLQRYIWRIIANLMGHKSGSTSRDTYTQINSVIMHVLDRSHF